MSRFPRRPAVWAAALGSLGLAALFAGPAIGWSEGKPEGAIVSADEDVDGAKLAAEEPDDPDFGDDADDADDVPARISVRDDDADADADADADDDADDAPVRISIRSGDEDEEDAGEAPARLRIRNEEPAQESSPKIVAPKAVALPEPPAIRPVPRPPAVRVTDSAPTEISARRQPIAAKPVPAPRVNPVASNYPFEPTPRSARHSQTQFESDNAEDVLAANDALGGAADEVQERGAAQVEGAAAEPALAAIPAANYKDVEDFSEEITKMTQQHPIGKLKADMKMRLPKQQRSLQEEESRKGLLAVDKERQIARAFYKRRDGLGRDHSTFIVSDASLAPELPFCYHPLYFEDANLERCGYSNGCLCQSAISGFQFYGNVALLPLKLLVLPCCSYVYPQEDCEPCMRYSCCDNMWGPWPEQPFCSPCFSSRCWK
jgi:hypothetical protein